MKSTDNNAEADGESTKEDTGSAIQQEPKNEGKATGQDARLVYYTTIHECVILFTLFSRCVYELIRKNAAVSGSTNRIFFLTS